MRLPKLMLAVALAFACAACAPKIPKEALQLAPDAMAQRQSQTKRFDTNDEKQVLQAIAALLQDLGFSLEASETDLGLIVGSKDRSAVEAGQEVAKWTLALLSAAGGAPIILPTDRSQRLRACVVTRPFGEQGESVAVRVTFQRIVWNDQNRVSKLEGLGDPQSYQQFFDLLSKSLFLEAHEL